MTKEELKEYHKVRSKKWRDDHKGNPPDRKEYHAQWYQANKEQQKKYRKIYWKTYGKTYTRKNPQVQTEYQRHYVKRRRKNDVDFYLRYILRARLSGALKKNSKVGSAVMDLGCTIPELKKYLESKFQSGMTWDNRGKEWHIDHIIPLIKFNLKDRQQLLIACHYTNLQPLWKRDNLTKHDFHVLDYRDGMF